MDIVKLFSSHDKLTICTYTFTYLSVWKVVYVLVSIKNGITYNFDVTYTCFLGGRVLQITILSLSNIHMYLLYLFHRTYTSTVESTYMSGNEQIKHTYFKTIFLRQCVYSIFTSLCFHHRTFRGIWHTLMPLTLVSFSCMKL